MNSRQAVPLVISAMGVLLDALTTMIGVSMGFYEIHPNYNPVIALMIFWTLIAVTWALPRTRVVRVFTILLSATPFLGAVNNSLVIIGFFPGLTI